MSTLHAAAELLAKGSSLEALSHIASTVGCSDIPAPLDDDALQHLGIGPPIAGARVARGYGALRALLLEVQPATSLREVVPRIATKLATRAPHALWLLVATHGAGGHEIAIAAWSGDRTRPRIAALIADRRHIVASDAESLRALVAARGDQDLLTHARWVEILGRETLTRRFYRALDQVVSEMAASPCISTNASAEIALLHVSRFLFLAFLEAKGWLDGDRAFLTRRFDACMATTGGFHRRVALPLFFGTLNTPFRNRAATARQFGRVPFLNGGLFARTPVERRARGLTFSDEAYGALLHGLFAQYRFTAREESSTWSEAAVDPEMLGKAFESLMASRERQVSGAYFTPHSMVDRVASCGLERALGRIIGETPTARLLAGERLAPNECDRARLGLGRLTILDPACGSGAFLVHVLERVADLLGQLGDSRSLETRRRGVLTTSIFGVDINPTAVWLCELRLWLSVVIEVDETDACRVEPLPNLDHNIRVGDALAGSAFGDAGRAALEGNEIRILRQRYAVATGRRKEAFAKRLDAAERRRALAAIDTELLSITNRRRELVTLRRGYDLFGHRHATTLGERASAVALRQRTAALRASRRRIADGGALPFSFSAHFADVGARGGFDLLVGNPPWVRLHRVSPAIRARYRRDFAVARLAAWEAGTESAAAGRGFGAQVDLAALFVERSIRLLAPGAVGALLVPVKLWHSLAGGGMRRLIVSETNLCRLEDYSTAPAAFDAAVYPSLIVVERRDSAGGTRGHECIDTAVHRAGAIVHWRTKRELLPFDDSPGAPWIVLPPDVRRAFDRIRGAGVPLADSAFGRPYLGVKCGCNDAFVVRAGQPLSDTDDLATVYDRSGRWAVIERSLLRPLVRGEHLAPWTVPGTGVFIIWTHDRRDEPLVALPPNAARWFSRWRRRLIARADARNTARWWSLFRTESARADRPRVVWGDLGRAPRAAVIHAGDDTVPLNSCYVARCRTDRDAFALAALLNSELVTAWLGALAEPARGGYRRYLGWTMSLLPIPADWDRACDLLAPLGEAAACGNRAPSAHELLATVLAAYGLSETNVAPLVAWMSS